MSDICTSCNSGTLTLRRSDRLRRWFQTVGVLLLLPAVLGVWLAWSWHDAFRKAWLSLTLTQESSVELRAKLEGLEVPDSIIERAVSPHYQLIGQAELDALTPAQEAAVSGRQVFYSHPVSEWREATSIQEGLAPFVLGLSIFFGSIGLMFLRTKRILICGSCGARERAPRSPPAADAEQGTQVKGACCASCGQGQMRRVSAYQCLRPLGHVGDALIGIGILGVLLGAAAVTGLSVDEWAFYSRFRVSGIEAIGIYFGSILVLVVGAHLSDKRPVFQCDKCDSVLPMR